MRKWAVSICLTCAGLLLFGTGGSGTEMEKDHDANMITLANGPENPGIFGEEWPGITHEKPLKGAASTALGAAGARAIFRPGVESRPT